MGAPRLARQTGLTVREAEQFIEQYFRVFSGVRAWLDRTRAEATRTGVVSTLTGRRRRIEGLEGGDPRTMANALNMAVNTPLQGTAADLLKLAMIRLGTELPRSRLPAVMLLTVHDELVFEVDEGAVEDLRALVRTAMESAMTLEVPLVVDTGVGNDWLEAH
jgi:DNA polymerase-1